eukprot:TRINITY_DN9140_c0_g1_i1.p1 TRINITY_DN9140_c0_g1~~TRINITY_DN9140_c0_g1_i1.p1  ORF type:complete len:357 (+),score=74.68 TRINITY_DN9140_c0_g1_i1:35-1072(+)
MENSRKNTWLWGILGTGRIAHDFAQALKNSDRGRVHAIASRQLSSAQDFATREGIERAYGAYEDLLNDPLVDVVYVATLQDSHCELTLAALEKGKPVLCEKPMGINTREVELMIECAKKNKVFLMEALWMRFFPLIQKTEEIIRSGAIGDVRVVQANFGWRNDFSNKNALTDPQHCGGSLLAVGCYTVALAMIAFQSNTPTEVSAQGHVVDGIDRQCSAILKFGADQNALLLTSIEAETDGEATIVGSKGRIRLPFPFLCPTKLLVKLDGKEEESHECTLPSKGEGYNFINSSGLVYEAEEVHNCLERGQSESKIVSHEFSLALVSVLDSIRSHIKLRYPKEEKQ